MSIDTATPPPHFPERQVISDLALKVNELQAQLAKLASHAQTQLQAAADQIETAKAEADIAKSALEDMRPKFLELENERDVHTHRVNSLMRENELLKARDAHYRLLEDALFVMKKLASVG